METEEDRNRALLLGGGGRRAAAPPKPPASSDTGGAGASGAGATTKPPPADEEDDPSRSALFTAPSRGADGSTSLEKATAHDASGDAAEDDLPDIDYTFANFDDLDITTENVDFDRIDEDLANFQQDGIVREALEKGVDLRNYSRQIDTDLRRVQIKSIGDYVAEAGGIAELHSQITNCEDILNTMQSMLQGFQSKLGGISSEIKHLQDRSLEMNIQLRNRKAVADKLQLFLDKVAVDEALIRVICEGPINDEYVKSLKLLSTKIAYTASHARRGAAAAAGESSDPASDFGIDPANTNSGRDVIPQLERLRVKAVQRVRHFLLTQIERLRSARSNVQMSQEHVLLRFKYLLEFLGQHAVPVCTEVCQAYIDLMGRMLVAVFKTYHGSLHKLRLNVANKTDLIAVEQNAVRGLFSSKVDLSKRADAFALGDRVALLDDLDAPTIVVHIAQAEKKKLPYECLFRSMQRHLMDAATSEYGFVLEFFGTVYSRSKTSDIFYRVFAKALSLALEKLEDYLFSCYDAIGLLLMIHITNAHRRVMQSRRVPVLDTYFDRVSMLLWPRFKAVFDMNLKSIKVANPRKLGTIELQPHYVTRRYAEFSSSILSLHKRLVTLEMSDESVTRNLLVMRTEFVKLLQRLASERRNPKERSVLLINNLDQILRVQEERKVDAADDLAYFTDLRAQHIKQFVDEQLATSFGRLILFVKQTEAANGSSKDAPTADAGAAGSGDASASAATAASSARPKPRVDEATVEALVMDFAANWKTGIEAINGSVITYFSNYHNGMEILKQVLTQLLMYYTRFQDIIKSVWTGSPPPFSKHIVSVTSIFFEIKKYSRNSV